MPAVTEARSREAVTGVPDLTGKTEQQAAAALQSAGFAVGTVKNTGSGGKVSSQSPPAPSYAVVGDPIGFTLGTSSPLRTPLSLHVVGSDRVNPLIRPLRSPSAFR